MSNILLHNRRIFLRNAFGLLNLPLLESIVGEKVYCAAQNRPNFVFIYFPNGSVKGILAHKSPEEKPCVFGGDSSNHPYASFLKYDELQGQLRTFFNLNQLGKIINGPGEGPHVQEAAGFLTGQVATPKKTKLAESVDNMICSLEGYNQGRPLYFAGRGALGVQHKFTNGLGQAYENLSWASDSKPNAAITSTKILFNRVITGNENSFSLLAGTSNSPIIDFYNNDLKRIVNRVSRSDELKLKEFEENIFDLETSLSRSQRSREVLDNDDENAKELQKNDKDQATSEKRSYECKSPDFSGNSSIDAQVTDVLNIAASAINCGLTQVFTYNMGSTSKFPRVKSGDHHNDYSHHKGDSSKKSRLLEINRFYAEKVAEFASKIKDLDNTVIAFGPGMADGNTHSGEELPLLLCGGNKFFSKPASVIKADAKNHSLASVWYSFLTKLGSPKAVGNMTGNSNAIDELV